MSHPDTTKEYGENEYPEKGYFTVSKKHKEAKKHKVAKKMSPLGKLKEMISDRDKNMPHKEWFKKHGLPK